MNINSIKNYLTVAATAIVLTVVTTVAAQAQNRGNNRGSEGSRSAQQNGGVGSHGIDRGSQNRGVQTFNNAGNGAGRDFRDGRNQPQPAPVVTPRVNPGFGNPRITPDRREDFGRDQRNNVILHPEFRDRILRYNNDRLFYDNLAIGRYQIYRNGGYLYNTDQYGVAFLRQAMSLGYEEGVRAGQADRSYGRSLNYQGIDEYRSGNFGFEDGYVDSGLYQYYFQQGFQRGYEDGFYGNWQYGSYNSGTFTILGSIVDSVLSFRRY